MSSSGSFSALSQGDEEGVVQSGDGQADGAIANGLDRLCNSSEGLNIGDVDQGNFNRDRGGLNIRYNQPITFSTIIQ